MISRPALRYHGGKFRLAPWIVAQMPAHCCYVEPYGGGASVLLTKPPSFCEVYNDQDSDVVAFFRVLRDDPDSLIRAIRLTPYSRTECRLAWERADGDLERARRLYVRSWQARCSHARENRGSWRFQRAHTRGQSFVEGWAGVEHLGRIAHRLLKVQIEEEDALAVIRRYDTKETLFYVDPPYVASTRGRPDHGYAFEMSDEDHEALAETLHRCQGMVLLSGYPSALYDRLYGDWGRVSVSSQTQSSGTRMEVLWKSPSVRAWQLGLPGLEAPFVPARTTDGQHDRDLPVVEAGHKARKTGKVGVLQPDAPMGRFPPLTGAKRVLKSAPAPVDADATPPVREDAGALHGRDEDEPGSEGFSRGLELDGAGEPVGAGGTLAEAAVLPPPHGLIPGGAREEDDEP